MNDIMNSLFNATESIGVIPETDHHNHIITESAILDRVNGDKDALSKVLSEVGNYAVRDNLLEDAQLVQPCDNAKTLCHAKRAAVLATAKEAGDPDFQTYCKCFALVKKLMDNMCCKYSCNADARVSEVNRCIDNSPRLVNAINTINDGCCSK